MIKKVLIAGLFLGGGLYFIKKNFNIKSFGILPLKTKKVKKLSIDETIAKEKAKQDRYNMELQNKITQTGLYNLKQYGGKSTRWLKKY